MGQKVFINYRRRDSRGEARALREFFAHKMPQLILDADIEGDIRRESTIAIKREAQVASSDVLICLIGEKWGAISDKDGRLLDDPADYVRREIGAALRREIPVLPVLLDDAQMPVERDLPDDIRGLAYKQALRLRTDKFDSDTKELAAELRAILKRRLAPTSSGRLAVYSIAALLVGAMTDNLLMPRMLPPSTPASVPEAAAQPGINDSLHVGISDEARAASSDIAARDGRRFDLIRQRGRLSCGVENGLAGFSVKDPKTGWQGLDIDMCKGIAAVLVGDASKVDYVEADMNQSFNYIQTGKIDVLSWNTTWTLTREAQRGLHFPAITYYDAQAFMVRKDRGVRSTKDLGGVAVCVQSQTTSYQNLEDYFRENRLSFKPIPFSNVSELGENFFLGACDAITSDRLELVGLLSTRPVTERNNFVILPEAISKEPLALVINKGDQKLSDLVKWTVYALIAAEEYGITQANADQVRRTSLDQRIARILGKSAGIGHALGVEDDWALRAIKAVGNYGEIWERNVKPLGEPRGLNNLWSKGGLMYAPPIQ